MRKLIRKARATIRQEVQEGIRETNLTNYIAATTEQISRLEKSIDSSFNSLTIDINKLIQETIKQSAQGFKAISAPQKILSTQDRIAALRTALDRGAKQDVFHIVKALALEKKWANRQYLDCANQMHDMILQKNISQQYNDALKELFQLHTVDEFRREEYLDVFHMKFPVMQAASLRQQFVRRRRMKQIGDVPDRWLVYNKLAGEEFAKMVGFTPPYSEHGFTLDQLPHKTDVVIKPLSSASSIGVYIVQSESEILSVEHAERLHSWEEMVSCLHADLKSGRIQSDCFEVQEAIYSDAKEKSPAHDLKFYSFYGDIPAVLEIVRLPEKAYWWWTPDGELIDIGKSMPDRMKPVGFTPEMLESAKRLSLKIPAPYMRLDFLRGDNEIYFDEFCTMSGGEFAIILEQHFPKWDRLFGNCYLKAEMRLINDLLDGKRFDEINAFNRICEERYRK